MSEGASGQREGQPKTTKLHQLNYFIKVFQRRNTKRILILFDGALLPQRNHEINSLHSLSLGGLWAGWPAKGSAKERERNERELVNE